MPNSLDYRQKLDLLIIILGLVLSLLAYLLGSEDSVLNLS
jgi:hypothetical protein